MPDIKRTFQRGKMNKDLDERIVPNGEYRHAVNVQVNTTDKSSSDGGAAGTIQNLKGNFEVGRGYYENWMSESAPTDQDTWAAFGNSMLPRCIASVADEKNNKAYFFFASSIVSPVYGTINTNSENERHYVDLIVEQDSNGTTTPVVVDKFAYVNTISSAISGQTAFSQAMTTDGEYSTIPVDDASNYRVGMDIQFLNTAGENVLTEPVKIKAIDFAANTLLLQQPQTINFITSGAVWILAEAPRVLNFTPGTLGLVDDQAALLPNVITGINIIDDLLFWTDSYSEPKKINIKRCKAGTDIGNTSDFTTHTKLYVEDKDGNLVNAASISNVLDSSSINDTTGLQTNGGGVNSDLREEHIAVIRKAPRYAPTLHMNTSDRPGTIDVPFTFQFVNSSSNTTIDLGEIYTITSQTFFDSNFRKDDVLQIERTTTNPLEFKARFVCYLDSDNEEALQTTSKIKLEILQEAELSPLDQTWTMSVEKKKPLFELKMVRFGYRYKYQDGEYSSFSPFSEVAFLPGGFDYTISDAFNLGMVNTVRELIIKDFIPYTIPLDVIEVDILYKTTDNANVYVVETVKKDKDSEWELFTPDGATATTDIQTGQLSITSEMIHRVLPENQTLRTWDNVPRYALAQEITGNRLIYANYTQGYDIKDPINLTQQILSENIPTIEEPKKSLKTIRDYKIGMVFGDKYGRETPVITSGYTTIDNSDEGYSSITGDISIPKILSNKKNSFVVSQTWGDPNVSAVPPLSHEGGWIDYVKYYIKETSNEYYNLVLDRFYDSGDHGTVWLSFNSSDRNKIDEETHLILKNRHGSNQPVLEDARYKVIAIENEAPTYIQKETAFYGSLELDQPTTTYSVYDSMFVTAGGSPVGLFGAGINNSGTLADSSALHLWIDKAAWQSAGFGQYEITEVFTNTDFPNQRMKFRIVGRNSTDHNFNLTTGYRYISSATWGNMYPNSAQSVSSNQGVHLNWLTPFEQTEVDFETLFTALYDNGSSTGEVGFNPANLEYIIEFYTEGNASVGKPEFDGKFFVKIKRDITFTNNVETTLSADWELLPQEGSTYKLHYIESKSENQAINSSGLGTNFVTNQAIEGDADFDGTTADGTAWFGGAFANAVPAGEDDMFDNASFYLNFDGTDMADPTGPVSGQDGGNPIDFSVYDADPDVFTNNPSFVDALNFLTNDDIPSYDYGLPNLYGSGFSVSSNTYSVEQISVWEGYPTPGSSDADITQFSPFGSCSENYNDMTYDFWANVYTSYESSVKTIGYGDVDPATGLTGPVFLDSVNMAKMNIQKGPNYDEIAGAGAPETNGPHGTHEGGFVDDSGDYSKYWKPLNAFHVGYANNLGLGTVGAQNGTVGSMCISYSGSPDQLYMPQLFSDLRESGTYFRFDDDPTSVYVTVGVIHSSNGWEDAGGSAFYQYNYRGIQSLVAQANQIGSSGTIDPTYFDALGDDGVLTIPATGVGLDIFASSLADINTEQGLLDSVDYAPESAGVNYFETANCDAYPNINVSATTAAGEMQAHNKCAVRHTQWVEFRKINDSFGPSEDGLDLSSFDPRSKMHHDGRDSVGITILLKSQTSIDLTQIENYGTTIVAKGACFETEPKESVDVDLYYEASTALPMVLNKDNAFDFAPINSKVSVTRISGQNSNGTVETLVEFPTAKNVRVNNIHFSNEETEQAIISLISETPNTTTEFDPDDTITSLHKQGIVVGDTIHFEHSNGLKTSAVVKSIWEPVDPDDLSSSVIGTGSTAFNALTDTDTITGVQSGPKSFRQTTANPVVNFCTFELQNGYGVIKSQNLVNTTVGSKVSQIAFTNLNGEEILFPVVGDIELASITDDPNNVDFSIFTFSTNNVVVDNTWLTAATDSQGDAAIATGEQFGIIFNAPTGYYGIDINVYKNPVNLAWHNCYAFGNGVESDRIRDDFNAPKLDNGVKVSTTFSGYREENITSGMIYSGLYNSTSEINNLNEFNQAEKITKNLNPVYGAIQALKTRDTDVVVFTEDKVLKVLSNKDAIFNADGTSGLTATKQVLGTAIPFVGDYGISQNPESLSSDQYRLYFTDRARGAVLRLSRDGLTPISDVGMKEWFRENLRVSNKLLGSFDKVTGEYNLTINYAPSAPYSDTTVSFNEASKGWVSFKSFIPSQGLSLDGKYFTTNSYKIYKHHADLDYSSNIVDRNTFYGEYGNSEVRTLFNEAAGNVKSFKYMSYEGSQAKITPLTGGSLATSFTYYNGNITFDTDGNPIQSGTDTVSFNSFGYQSIQDKEGWWCDSLSTDLQIGKTTYFKNKEGKWFGYVKGVKHDTNNSAHLNLIDTNAFNVQGIGQVYSVNASTTTIYDPGTNDETTDNETGCPEGFTINDLGDCVEFAVLGCTDPLAQNFDENADVDDGTCIYALGGCTDPFAPNYDNLATYDDASCQQYVNGCMDDGSFSWSPNPLDADGNYVPALNYNANATQAGYLVNGVFNQIVFSDGTLAIPNSNYVEVICTMGASAAGTTSIYSEPTNYYGCCEYDPDVIEPEIPDDVGNDDFTNLTEDDINDEANCVNSGGYYVIGSGGAGICYGCTDPTNENYNPQASVDCDNAPGGVGTCIDDGGNCPCCKPSQTLYDDTQCTDPLACNYNPEAIGSCLNLDCCEYVTCYCCGSEGAVNYNNLVYYVGGASGDADTVATEFQNFNTLYNYPLTGNELLATCLYFVYDDDGDQGCNFSTGTVLEDVYGCLDPEANNYLGDEAVAAGALPCPEGNCDDVYDNSWCQCCTYGAEGEIDQEVDQEGDVDNPCNEIGVICGCTDPTMYNYNPLATLYDGSCVPFNYGCTNPESINWNPQANTNDGSCIEMIPGCTDSSAQNFEPTANIDNGTCYYGGTTGGEVDQEADTDGDGSTTDGDGVTTAIPGCTEPDAYNYNPDATENNGTCIERICGCLDSTATNYNPDANTIYQFLTQAQVAQVVNGFVSGQDILGTLENQGFDTSTCPEAECEYPTGTEASYSLFVDNENLDDDNSHPGTASDNQWPLN